MKGYWNHRVIHGEQKVGPITAEWWAIHEVHYDEHNHIVAWTAEPTPAVTGEEGIGGLMWVLTHMRKALQKPILELTELEAEMEKRRTEAAQ